MKLVLDASVAIKFYASEDDSGTAIGWLARDCTFFVPDIFLVEVTQALLRHTREGRLAQADLGLAVEDLCRIVEVPLGSGRLLRRALVLADLLHHRLHDCMYLALAERLDCALLTADDRLVRKVRDHAPFLTTTALNDPIP